MIDVLLGEIDTTRERPEPSMSLSVLTPIETYDVPFEIAIATSGLTRFCAVAMEGSI